MYKRCAIQFHNKKMEFISSLNMIERIKKARALTSGVAHLGIKQYVVSSTGLGKKTFLTMKDRENL